MRPRTQSSCAHAQRSRRIRLASELGGYWAHWADFESQRFEVSEQRVELWERVKNLKPLHATVGKPNSLRMSEPKVAIVVAGRNESQPKRVSLMSIAAV